MNLSTAGSGFSSTEKVLGYCFWHWRTHFNKGVGFARLGLIFLMALATQAAHALDAPSGEVLLTIGGDITISNATENDKPVAKFDLDLLQSLGETSFTTSSPWTVESKFSGVRLSTLLEAVGVNYKDSTVRADAVNDYWFDLMDLDLDLYPIIVAYKKDDKLMTVRELGPLWIVFPWDLYPHLLDSEKNKASSVWQLLSLTVK